MLAAKKEQDPSVEVAVKVEEVEEAVIVEEVAEEVNDTSVTMASMIKIPCMADAPGYDHWKNMITMWTKITTTVVKKQALAIALTLPVEGQKLAMQMGDDLEKEDGSSVPALLKKLDELYELNKDQKIFAAFEAFEQFKRPEDMPIVKFIAGFDELVNELVAVDIKLPEPLLAYKLLKGANLEEEARRVVRATCKELNLIDMKKALLNVFEARFQFGKGGQSANSRFEPTSSQFIKSEPVYQTRSYDQTMVDSNDTFEVTSSYNNGRGGASSRGRSRGNHRSSGSNRYQPYYDNWRSNDRGGSNSGTDRGGYNSGTDRRQINRTDSRTGQPSQCRLCNSIYHWANQCPRKDQQQQQMQPRQPTNMTSTTAQIATCEVNFNTMLLDDGTERPFL
jgi:hypothetical protein